MRLSAGSMKDALYDQLLASVESRYGASGFLPPILQWAESLLLDGQPFCLEKHAYQRDFLKEDAHRQVYLKGAQIGATSAIMLKTLHGMIGGRYPQGSLYLFPSRNDVLDFSRGRFNPLINDNTAVAQHIQDTDSQTIKRIGKAMLYLRGARATASIGGMKRTSSQLKSIPVDRVVFDEVDEMSPDMIDLALERLSHSSVKEEVYLSTPTIPDYGVDRLFRQSDQRHWFIRCSKCGGETCLELEFPDCLEELQDRRVIRLCQRCKDKEIYPHEGRWVALYPDKAKDIVGWRISQLYSLFVEPGKILKLFRDPPQGNITEVYNSKLAQAHIEAENRLSYSEIINLCGDKPIVDKDIGPCFLGADVGRLIHCVIGKKHPNKAAQIDYIGSFPEWEYLNTLMRRFNVSRAVIDGLPETRLARSFAEAHKGKVFLCFYNEHQKGGYAWHDEKLTVQANRTESLDASHTELAGGKIILPGECSTLQEFARHCTNVARVLQRDPDTGSSRYAYLQTGDDHYRHAFNYECMARQHGSKSFFGECDLT